MSYVREALLGIINESDCVYIDGTFKLSPPQFAQVVVIIGKKRELAVPVLYCLLQVSVLPIILNCNQKQLIFISEFLMKWIGYKNLGVL